MGRRILAVLAALLALLWAAVPAYAASPAVDSAYLTREPWQNVPVTEFRADGAMGYYQIYADTDNHCLYFAVSMQDQQVEPGANTAAVALNLQVSSAKFSTKKFTFTTGANKALQSYDGIASGCNMQVEILENSGGYGIADGNAYFAIALNKSLCGPLTVRLDYNCGERGICLLSTLLSTTLCRKRRSKVAMRGPGQSNQPGKPQRKRKKRPPPNSPTPAQCPTRPKAHGKAAPKQCVSLRTPAGQAPVIRRKNCQYKPAAQPCSPTVHTPQR